MSTKPQRRIGGSMIAKVVGRSRWGTPLDAYLDLRGERPPEERTGEDIDRGNFLEPALREWAGKKLAVAFEKPTTSLVDPSWEWASVSPDGLSVLPPKTLLEIKAPRRGDDWGEEGSDEVPTDALLQTHWGMMITGSESGVVAALLGGELRIFRVARDRELEAALMAKARQFVEAHVLPGVPPPATFGDDSAVLRMFPKSNGTKLAWDSLTPAGRDLIHGYLAAYREEKDAAARLERFEPEVKQLIGDAEGLVLPPEVGKRVDWKSNATGSTRWKDLALSLLEGVDPADVERLKRQFESPPPRVLRPWFNKEKP
jgi:hypothetical protein